MSLPGAEPEIAAQAARYLAVGVLNTLMGGAVILALLSGGAPDLVANAAGFAVGLSASFLINRRWTFGRGGRPDAAEGARFIAVIAVAYLANVAVLVTGGVLGAGGTLALHLSAIATYAVIGFVGMRAVAFAPDPARLVRRLGAASPATLVCLAAAIALLLLVPLPIGHDVVWQFWIARQLNNGVELYAQINEVNPPLWFWMAMPLERLAGLTGISPPQMMKPAMVALAFLSALLAAAALPGFDRRRRGLFAVNAFALGLVLALPDFAQREHIAMLAALPWCLLIVRRADCVAAPLPLALAIALVAATGLALKHYFAAVPLALELWLLLRLGRRYRPLRPETLTLALCMAAYVAAILRLAPAYLSDQVPMVVAAYEGYARPLIYLLRGHTILWAMLLLALGLTGLLARERRDPLLVGLLVAAAGFAVSYAVQRKGWPYHGLPVTYFLSLAWLAVAIRWAGARPAPAPDGAKMMAPAMLLVAYLTPIATGGLYDNRFADDFRAASDGAPPGSSIYVLTTDPRKSWPMLTDDGHLWPSRFMALWMVPAIATGTGEPATLAAVSDRIRAETAEDLRCHPPSLILVDRRPFSPLMAGLPFDLFAYLAEHDSAGRVLDDYVADGETATFSIYRRTAEIPAAPPAGCRPVY